MGIKWRSNENGQARSVSTLLRDFVFGEPLPQPEAVERNDAQAWQDWLDAMTDLEAVIEFEDTVPSEPDELHAKRPASGDSQG